MQTKSSQVGLSQTAFVFFCHGARAQAWREPFDQITQEYSQANPTQRVELAFLELMQPDLPDTLDCLAGEGYRHVHVFPLFLAPGRHTQGDLPQLLSAARDRWPRIRFTASQTLMESPVIREVIVSWANACIEA